MPLGVLPGQHHVVDRDSGEEAGGRWLPGVSAR